MCDPLTLVGLGLTGASIGANTVGASQVAAEREAAQRAEMKRQAEYDADIAALNEDMRGRYDDVGEKAKGRKSKLEAAYAEKTADIPTGLTGAPAAAGDVIKQQSAASQKATTKELGKRGADRAELRAFSDVFGSTGLRNSRDAGMVGTLGGFKRASANILPLELEAANSAGSGFQLLGDILNMGGGLALTAGLSGASLPGLFGTGAAPPVPPVPAPRPMPPTPFATPTRLPAPRPGGLMSAY